MWLGNQAMCCQLWGWSAGEQAVPDPRILLCLLQVPKAALVIVWRSCRHSILPSMQAHWSHLYWRRSYVQAWVHDWYVSVINEVVCLNRCVMLWRQWLLTSGIWAACSTHVGDVNGIQSQFWSGRHMQVCGHDHLCCWEQVVRATNSDTKCDCWHISSLEDWHSTQISSMAHWRCAFTRSFVLRGHPITVPIFWKYNNSCSFVA